MIWKLKTLIQNRMFLTNIFNYEETGADSRIILLLTMLYFFYYYLCLWDLKIAPDSIFSITAKVTDVLGNKSPSCIAL